MIAVFIFILGTIWGSFLNVCIIRLPQKKSIISLPSTCPQCGQKLKKTHIIPIISYVFLRGNCYYCSWNIPAQYLIVELLTGIITILLYIKFSINPLFFKYSIFCYILIVISFIDIEKRLIFDKITLPGIVLGITIEVFLKNLTLINIALGIVVGCTILILSAISGQIVFKRESLGGGDIKLAAMIGSFLGLNNIVFTIIIAVFAALLISLFAMKLSRNNYIPFGPFLSLGAIISIFYSIEFLKI